MPNFRKFRARRGVSAVLLVPLIILTPVVMAQQGEIPPASSEQPATGDPDSAGEPEETGRIVDEKPALYQLKRNLHPVTWLEAGVRPLLRIIEGIGPESFVSEEKSSPASGIKFGIQALGSGSGFGPEVKPFHRNLFNEGLEVEIPLVVTYKFYESLQFRARYPVISSGPVDRISLEFTSHYSSRASDKFFGFGNDSSQENETRFRSVSRTAALAVEAYVSPAWNVRVESSYRNVGVTQPRYFRSATEAFGPTEISNLTNNPAVAMVTTSARVERNTKNRRYMPDSGGLQRFEVALNEGLRGDDFSYWTYRAELQQLVALSEDRRKVLAFRGSVETNQEKSGSEIPFFDLPTVGSRSTVRGFQSRRFIDKSAMTFSLEYRYRIWRYFDWALFADSGQVAPEIGDFAWNRLHTGYGIRFIARSEGDRAISFDIARSRETWKFYVNFSPTF